MIAQICERARQRVGLPSGRTDIVGIGCELSLWSPLLSKWLVWMRDECPEIDLNATVAPPAHLLERVQEGSLDVAILYNPPTQYALAAELLSEKKLVLVSTLKSNAIDPERYVHVGWGTAFNANLSSDSWRRRDECIFQCSGRGRRDGSCDPSRLPKRARSGLYAGRNRRASGRSVPKISGIQSRHRGALRFCDQPCQN